VKLIVFGASGFIGHYIFSLAKEKGYNVIGTQSSNKSTELIKFDFLTDSIIDVIPQSFLETDEPVCAVICAAMCKINTCFYEREYTYNVNVINTIKLIKDLNYYGIKSAFLSSDYVYDGIRGYYDESIPPCPVTEYGRHKAEVEKFILNDRASNLILRLGMNFGDEYIPGKHPLADWYKLVCEDKPIACIDGQLLAPTYVKDTASGIIIALEKNFTGLYNLVNSEFFYRDELVRQFLYKLNINHDIIVKPLEEFGFPEKRPLKTYLDGAKFRREAGFVFASMKEVFERFLAKNTCACT